MAADPANGCKKMKGPPNNSTVNWFALIRRFGCNFADKVRNAEAAGYSGVIVYNIQTMTESRVAHFVNRHTTFAGFTDDPQIPAILISHDDGKALNDSYLYDRGYFVVISPDLQFNLSAYLLPFAIVISVCLILMISFMVIKCIRDRRKTRRHRLSLKHLKKIPTTKYKKGEFDRLSDLISDDVGSSIGDQYDTCAICLDEYTEGEKLRLLPCAHG